MSQLLRPIGALRAGLERIGRGDLDTPIVVRDRTELGLLAGTVNDMASALKGAQAEMVERERLAHEVELAREIQRSLLPSAMVTAGAIEVRGDQRAAAEVGGDYWDVLTLPDRPARRGGGRRGGQGPRRLPGDEHAVGAAARRPFRTMPRPPRCSAPSTSSSAESLRPGVFVTMCYAILDPATGRLTFASAGHNPLVVWRRRTGELEVVSSRGIPLGAIRGGAMRASLRDESLTLEPGDSCVMFTDGYTEAFREGGEELFGMERLLDIIGRAAPGGGEAVLSALRDAVRAWSGDGVPSDDETLVVLSHVGGAASDRPADQAWTWRSIGWRGPSAPAAASCWQRDSTGSWRWIGGSAAWTSSAACPRRLEVLGPRSTRPWPTSSSTDTARTVRRSACRWLPEPAARRALRIVRHSRRRPPFRPSGPPVTDFNDLAVRTRGRGIGIEIMHRGAGAGRLSPGHAARQHHHPVPRSGRARRREIAA